MAHWLFPDLLKDSSAYARAQRHWEAVWMKVLSTTDLAQAWQSPWMSNPFPDGNPIFTAVSPSLHRGVRIIQEEPGEPDDTDLDWWLDHFGEQNEPDAIHELVIACCPSRENAAQIEHLLSQWVASGDLHLPQPVGEAEIE
jgi:hypothetical protein